MQPEALSAVMDQSDLSVRLSMTGPQKVARMYPSCGRGIFLRSPSAASGAAIRVLLGEGGESHAADLIVLEDSGVLCVCRIFRLRR